MMASIQVILVQGADEQLKVVHIPEWHFQLTLDVDAETAIEAVRTYFERRWNAKVHGLRWLFPEDVLRPQNPQGDPVLVLWAETLGTVPLENNDKDETLINIKRETSDGLAAFLETAERPCHREPWSLPSWLPNTANWIQTQFGAIRQLSQVRTCSHGSVLRIESRDRTYFLKTQLEPLAYESALLMLLNRHIPGACPRILPISPDANTHLTEAINGCPMNALSDQQSWRVALTDVANLQIECVDLVAELRHVGVPHHGLEDMATTLEETLNELIASQRGSRNELTPQERLMMSSLISKATHDFEVLHQYAIPETLVHGDLNQSNVFRTETGGTVLIDWALSRVTHPFFVVASALFEPYAMNPQKPAFYDDLCSAYLEPWHEFQSHDRLQAALDAASRLFWIDSTVAVYPLCRAGHFCDRILPRFLRAALRAYKMLG